MADGRHLEKSTIRPYLGNGLTDRCEIWHDDAYWPFKPYQQIQTFKNRRWRTTDILKNKKRPYLRNGLIDLNEILHGDAY